MKQEREEFSEQAPNGEIAAEPQRPEPRHPLPKPEMQPAPTVEQSNDEPSQSSSADRPGPNPESSPPLPDLAASDEPAVEVLTEWVGPEFVQRFIKPQFVIPRTVAIVNTLDDSAPTLKAWPVNPLGTDPRTREIEGGDGLLWTRANAARYDDWLEALEAVPAEEAAARYARWYPLFQRAWEELGEDEPWFNDRLIDVIDHLLATPAVALPFPVVAYEGRFNFADEALQEQSWGRKIITRMGPEHADRVKAWLQQFRNAAVGVPAPAP